MELINRFWPFDLDDDCEIYENPAWDLPGQRLPAKPLANRRAPSSVRRKRK